MKRILAFALTVLMVIPLMTFAAHADAKVTADTSWYDAAKSEFTLTTAAQLYGLSSLSSGNNFSGKTIKLGADITVNTGDSASWAASAPTNSWTPIKNFAGTFDGQNHTISGIYAKGTSSIGFFAGVNASGTVCNLKLVNSYFHTTAASCAAISAGGAGAFRNIYTDAIVYCGDHHAGGIFGVAGGKVVVENCWFDGSVTLEKRYGAGIVGNGNGQHITITNCLNSGTVYTKQTAAANSHIGGMCGRNDNTTIITGCLNVGKVSSAYMESGASDVLGSIFGACSGNTKNAEGTAWLSHVSISNCWATTESCPVVLGSNGSTDPSQLTDYHAVSLGSLMGYSATVNTTLDFSSLWAVDLDGFPILRIFADEIPQMISFNIPTLSHSLKTSEGYGPKWTLSLTLPSGFTKNDVEVGLLVAPTKAIPVGKSLDLSTSSFDYNGKICKVANIKGDYVQSSDASTVVATFVITDLMGSTALTQFTAVPYAIYSVNNSVPVEVYGNSDGMSYYREAVLALNSADAATKAQINADLAPIDSQLGGRFPVTSAWSQMDLFETVPAVTFGTVAAPVDYGVNNYVVAVTGATTANYTSYGNLLVQFGFSRHASSNVHGKTYNSSYIKGDVTVNLTYMVNASTLYLSVARDLPLSEHLLNTFSDDNDAVANESLHVNQLWSWGNSILIQLKNGHFLMNDGATPYELPYLLDYMESLVPEGEVPVVEAWFFSHFHYDHSCVLNNLPKNPDWADRVIVDAFYYSEPSDAAKDADGQRGDILSQMAGMRKAASMLRDQNGEAPKHYRVHTGQRLYFSDMTVDVLLTQEQIPYSTYKGGFNDSSTWLSFNIGSQDVVIGGDSHQAGMQKLMDTYTAAQLNFDVFFTLHHGSNTWDTFTNYCTFKTVLVPGPYSTGAANQNVYNKAINAGGEVVCAQDGGSQVGGNIVLTFPYTVGSYKKLPSTAWIYNQGETKPNA